jgi:hypothetical protein
VTDYRPPNPLETLAKAYLGQGMDTLARLLRLVPDGYRHRVLLAWRIGLTALAQLSEDELTDAQAHELRLTQALREDIAVILAARAARRDGPSQARPSEGA